MLAPRCRNTLITNIITIISNGIGTIKDANTNAPTTKSSWSKIGAGFPLSSFKRRLMKLPQASPINAPPPRAKS